MAVWWVKKADWLESAFIELPGIYVHNCLSYKHYMIKNYIVSAPGASQDLLVIKNPSANEEEAGDADPIPGLGRTPGRGHGNPLQCSCLENPMDRGAWQAIVHSITRRQTGLKHTHKCLRC